MDTSLQHARRGGQDVLLLVRRHREHQLSRDEPVRRRGRRHHAQPRHGAFNYVVGVGVGRLGHRLLERVRPAVVADRRRQRADVQRSRRARRRRRRRPGTGAYVFFDGGAPREIGGTSLAAPLWAGHDRDLERGEPRRRASPASGSSRRSLYSIGNNPTRVPLRLPRRHQRLVRRQPGRARLGRGDRLGFAEPRQSRRAVPRPDADDDDARRRRRTRSPSASTVVYTATVSPTPTSGTVTFRQNGRIDQRVQRRSRCRPGVAHCIGRRTASPARTACRPRYSGNADARGSPSNTLVEQVDPAPAAARGYWMVGATGSVYGFGASNVARQRARRRA